jgi:hypothetical protein
VALAGLNSSAFPFLKRSNSPSHCSSVRLLRVGTLAAPIEPIRRFAEVEVGVAPASVSNGAVQDAQRSRAWLLWRSPLRPSCCAIQPVVTNSSTAPYNIDSLQAEGMAGIRIQAQWFPATPTVW